MPAGQKRKRLITSIAAALLVILAGVILWFTALPPFVEDQIIKALTAQGFPEASIRLSELTPTRATLEQLELGGDLGLNIQKIQIRYTPGSLRRSQVAGIILVGASFKMAYRDQTWDLGPFGNFSEAGDTTVAEDKAILLPFDRIELRDATIQMDYQGRQLVLPLEADLERTGQEEFSAQLRGSLEGAAITVRGTARLDSLSGRAAISIAGLPARLIHELVDSLLAGCLVESDGKLNIGGVVRFDFSGEPRWQAELLLTQQDLKVTAGLPEFPMDLSLDQLSANLDIAYPDTVSARLETRLNHTPLEFQGHYAFDSKSARGRLRLPDIPHELLTNLAETCLSEPSLAIAGSAELTAEAEFKEDSLAVTASLNGRRLEISTTIEPLRVQLSRPVIEADLQARLDSAGPSILGGELTIRRLAAAAADTAMNVSIDSATVWLPLPLDSLSPLRGIVKLHDVMFEHQQSGLRLSPPLVEGTFRMLGDEASFELSSTIMPDVLLIASGAFSGIGSSEHNQQKPSGIINARVPPFPLEQAAAVYRRMPAMAGVNLGGSLAADGRFELQGDSLRPRVIINLKDAWWEKPEAEARIEGMSGSILIDQLAPLSTEADQLLSWGRFSAGAFEATDGRARFRISGHDTSITGSVDCRWAGGRLWSDSVRVHPGTSTMGGEIHLEKISLQGILDFLEYEKVKGEGWIYGHLPVQVRYGENPRVSFGDGILKANPPRGRLQLNKETAMSILGITHELDPATSNQQEIVQLLMLQAVQDIEYSVLQATCESGGVSSWGATVNIQGHGPYGESENRVPIGGLNIIVNNLDRLLNNVILPGMQTRNLKLDG